MSLYMTSILRTELENDTKYKESSSECKQPMMKLLFEAKNNGKKRKFLSNVRIVHNNLI